MMLMMMLMMDCYSIIITINDYGMDDHLALFFFFLDATWITDWMILDHFGIRDYVRSIEYWRHLEGRGELNEHQFCGSFWIQKTVTSCVAGDGKQHCKEVHKIYTP